MSDNITKKFRFRMILLIFAGVLLMVPAIGLTADSETESSYVAVDGPCNLEFPENHGGHPGFRTEWWYYTGNLTSNQGRRFGYQLTIFRRQISPPGAERRWPRPASKWRTQHIYIGHAALSDISGGRHLYSEITARGALGLAGVERKGDAIGIFIQDWSIDIRPDTHRLKAGSAAFAFDLDLRPVKNPVLHGDKGYSRKGRSPQQASCYYSFSRLAAQGSIKLNGKDFAVAGLSWMDHEFSTAPLEPGTVGWDWFSLQLNNRTELMVFVLRRSDGTVNPASSGTFINRQGTPIHLTNADFTVTVLDDWKSPRTKAIYPARWRVEVPALEMALTVASNLADQELQTGKSTKVTYWEGSVSATGRMNTRTVQGQGYVEMTGYAGDFDAPI